MTQYNPPLKDVFFNDPKGSKDPFKTWAGFFRDIGIRCELGLYFGKQSTDQEDVETKTYINVFEAEKINVGEFLTIDSNSQATINVSGYYYVNFNITINRIPDGSSTSNRNTMVGVCEVDGANTQLFCYGHIENYSDGRLLTLSAAGLLQINSGETIRVWTKEVAGGESGDDATSAYISIVMMHPIK